MTRATFLSLFGLGAAAQKLPQPALPPADGKYCYYPLGWKPGDMMVCLKPDGSIARIADNKGEWSTEQGHVFKPVHRHIQDSYVRVNGECPVCGTQAPPFKVEWLSMMTNCKPTADPFVVSCEPVRSSMTGIKRQVECAHCRAVFGQDAEGESK